MFDIRINEIDVVKADLEKVKAGFVAISETLVEILQKLHSDRTDVRQIHDDIFAKKVAITRGVTLEGENIGDVILTKYSGNAEGIKQLRLSPQLNERS